MQISYWLFLTLLLKINSKGWRVTFWSFNKMIQSLHKKLEVELVNISFLIHPWSWIPHLRTVFDPIGARYAKSKRKPIHLFPFLHSHSSGCLLFKNSCLDSSYHLDIMFWTRKTIDQFFDNMNKPKASTLQSLE